MDNEAREQIVRIIHDCENDTCETCKWFNGIVGCEEPKSEEILNKLHNLGYRKIDLDKLTVLGDEEIDELWDKYERDDPMQIIPFSTIVKKEQLVHTIKQIEQEG